ncbi:MAG: hypothetical protein M1435_02535 [Actinobacteria bacterium]|nr:hypothetical protein [Actinomycetota bacterium]
MTTGPGWAYQLLVLFHIICAVGGFGAVMYRGFILDLARRRGSAGAAEAGVLAVYGQVSQFAEILIYGVIVFGVAAIGESGHSSEFHQPWVIASLVVYFAMLGVLHGIIRPAERSYRLTLLQLAQVPPMKPPARPPELARLDSLQRRISAGTGFFNVALVGVLYLMVFKP